LVELLIDRVLVANGDVEIRYVIPTHPRGETTRFCQLRKDYFHNIVEILNLADGDRGTGVSGSIRTKTYGSAVHTMFQILAGSQTCQGILTLRGCSAPRGDGYARQLSRKGWLNGSA